MRLHTLRLSLRYSSLSITLFAAALLACGPKGSANDDINDEPIDDLTTVGSVMTEPGESIDLGFGTLTTTHVTLPDGHVNAAEVYQLAHYIGRTDPESNEGDIDIPMRSYVATCNTDTDTPHLFVSVTLADGADARDETFGSVYELVYDPESARFSPTGNATMLPHCYESHGIAVSPDCSRVGVLCNIGHEASERYEVNKDLIEMYGTNWMKWEDNHAEIDRRIDNEFGLMLATNFNKYMDFFTEHPRLTIDMFLSGLILAFPDRGFDASTTFGDLRGANMADAVEYIVGQLSGGDRADLLAHVRDRGYKENEQIWLLEWDGQSLSEAPAAYVVNKMHGGTHTGAEELIYVHDDSLGRASYAFSVTARVFDDNGGSHYSAGLTVVDRDDWSIQVSSGGSDDDGRGWYWACGDGHLLNIRSFYNDESERYGAICTSDGNDWIGGTHGALGTIAIKMENRSSQNEGYSVHLVPSNSTLTSNGGGHTAVPIDDQSMLAVIVAPRLIADSDMDRFLADEVAVDPSADGPFDAECADYDTTNCFFSYMSYEYWSEDGMFPSIDRQGLMSGDALDSTSLTRIGLARVDADSGSTADRGIQWIVEDPDCQISDPQLVDLDNGRFLLGYARFQCISDGLGYERVYARRGADRMLVPKSYHVMEIDADGNVLDGPIALPNHGWGGVDEPVLMGPGRVAWTFIQAPTFDGYGGGQQSEWDVLVYESNATP